MKRANKTPNASRTGRRQWGRAQSPVLTDPYKAARKPKGPLACKTCGAVYRAGRWVWAPRPEGAALGLCQACQRVADDRPAGIVVVEGEFALAHKSDIVALARRQAEIENKEHPLNRIIAVKPRKASIDITTTDIHLPRRIGRALKRTFQGALDIDYDEKAYFVQANWRRDV